MELLKQPLGSPMSMADQVITLVAANDHIFSDLEPAKVKPFQMGMLHEFEEKHQDIIAEIVSSKKLSDDLKLEIETVAEEYKENQVGSEAV